MIEGEHMGEQRRSYPEELKRSALDLLRSSGKSAAAVAKDLGIDSGLLNRWRREEAQESGSRKAFTGQGVSRDEEVAQLRRENSDLREANDILKDDMFQVVQQS
jgi:transposase